MFGRTIQPILLQLACSTGSGQWHVSQAGSFFGEEWLKHQLVLFLSEDPKDKMIQFSIPSFYSSAYLGKLLWFQLLNRLYWAHGASSVQDGFKSEVLAEFHFQNFMSRADSFNFMSCPPRLSSTECTVYCIQCIRKPLRVWCLCVCGGYFTEVIAIHKVLPETRLQLREGVEATHSIAGLDLIPYDILVIFGSWVLGSSTLHKIHLPAHDLQ